MRNKRLRELILGENSRRVHRVLVRIKYSEGGMRGSLFAADSAREGYCSFVFLDSKIYVDMIKLF